MKIVPKNHKVKYSIPRTIGRGVLLVVLLALIPAMYFLPQLLIRGEAANYYCENIFPWVALLPQAINGMFMISLTELFAVMGSVTLIVLIFAFIIKCIKLLFTRDTRALLHFIYVVFRNVAIIGIIVVLMFELMHGINYNRTSVRKTLNLYGETRPYEDYEETLMWAYLGMVTARKQLGEDYHGVAHMSTSFESIVYDANVALSSLNEYYDLGLSTNYVRAKPVMLSHLWWYTGIAGFYDAFLGESNINTDYLDITHFAVTVTHEIVHARGFANETDANTIAVLACINSPRADFRYAGYYYIFMRLYSTVSEYASHEGVTMDEYFTMSSFDPVRRDIIAYNDYCDSFEEGPIADFIARFSEDANNAFLESNGQQGGTDTYVVPQNVYVEYFCRYIRTDG